MPIMKFDELVSVTGVTARQIRYLVGEGFVPPPTGGRTHARYDETHVTAIARYERLRRLGFPPAAIRLLLDARAGIPMPVANGVTLIIAPDLIGSGADAAPIIAKLSEAVATALSKEAPGAGRQDAG